MLATIVTMIVGYVVVSMMLIAVIIWPTFGPGVKDFNLQYIYGYLYMILLAPRSLPRFARQHLVYKWGKLYDEITESMIERET